MGINSISENIAIVTTKLIMVVNENMGYLNTLNSSIGVLMCNCLATKMIMATAPMPSVVKTTVSVQPSSPATPNPYNNPPKARVDRMIDVTSTFGLVVSVTFLKKKYDKIKSNKAIGNTMKNNTRHE